MTIRRATIEDAAGIADVQSRTWLDAYAGIVEREKLEARIPGRGERWRRILAAGTPTWVASEGEVVAGIMSAGPSRDEGAAGVGELWMLYVAPAAQGRGIGSALTSCAEDQLRAEGFAAATLWVFEQNAVGRAFYERAGWEPDGAGRDDDWAYEIRYRKSL